MPDQLNITNIPSSRVDIIDPRTGMISREWYRFFLNLFNLAGGGGNQISLDDIQVGPPPQSSTGGFEGVLPISQGGTGETLAASAFNALSPITTTGDLIVGNGTNSATRLGIGANGLVLTSNGTTATWSAGGASVGPSVYAFAAAHG
jgi:hypothetical protein